ncbi:MAG: type II secretion system F family protein [Candidatus Hydrogenedentes bacterium]|nr:type II secretion system F family protein [Candidatus Hydrogenedentota bacterium]
MKNIAKASVPSLAIAATLFAASIRVLERMDVAAVLTFLVIVILAAIPGWYMLLRNERLEALLLVLRDRMAGGATLSEAMRSLPRVFPRFLCDYVAAGEQSGQLAKALDSLGEESVRTLSQQRYIRLQFIYLFSVFFVIVAIMMFLTVKVLPVFLEIANEFSMDVPAISRAMGTMNYYLDDMGSPLRETGFQMLAGAAAIGAMLLLWRFRRSLRAQPLTTRYAGSLMLLVPWLRGLFQQQNLALASFMLEKLLRVGVPLDQALDTVAQAGVHPFYRKAFDRTRVAVVNGESLPDALDRERALLPGSFRGLVRVGERAGMLPDALLRLHDHYQREVMKRTRMLVDVLVPIGVILLGMLTLSVELGLFLLLTTLADNLAMPV